MFSSNPFIQSVDHWVVVWIGDLTLEELEDYLEEPGNADEDEPISEFSRDLGRWYDHDFIWAEGSEHEVSVRQLCEMNEVEPSEFVVEIERRGGDANTKCLLILWNAKVINESSRSFAGGKLKCIGCWEQESPLTD